mmetsp:Transcript_16390/g.26528  ORF Transcript_16390/g.26528 Transcript_16390/m.26528 type:complete len:105 (-) Transcript_16390:443-757(-)
MFPVTTKIGEDDHSAMATASLCHLHTLFGLSCQSKYVKLGMETCTSFNKYLNLTGDLTCGNRVSCAGSDNATLIDIRDDGSLTTQLQPFKTLKKYKNLRIAKIV